MNREHLDTLSLSELEKMANCSHKVSDIDELEMKALKDVMVKILIDFFDTSRSKVTNTSLQLSINDVPRASAKTTRDALNKSLCNHIKNVSTIIENAYKIGSGDIYSKSEKEILYYLFGELINELGEDAYVYITCYYDLVSNKNVKNNDENNDENINILELVKSSYDLVTKLKENNFFNHLDSKLFKDRDVDLGNKFMIYIGFIITVIVIYLLRLYNEKNENQKNENHGALEVDFGKKRQVLRRSRSRRSRSKIKGRSRGRGARRRLKCA